MRSTFEEASGETTVGSLPWDTQQKAPPPILPGKKEDLSKPAGSWAQHTRQLGPEWAGDPSTREGFNSVILGGRGGKST